MAPSTFEHLRDAFLALSHPWLFMFKSTTYLPGTVIGLVRAGEIGTLLSWSKFQTAWFGNFWAWAGPNVRMHGERNVVPLLEGRVHNGVIVPEAPSSDAGVGGVVLEIGPGSGMWVSIFSDRYLATGDAATTTGASTDENDLRSRGPGMAPTTASARRKVTRVFGVEPNPGVHPLLKQQIAKAGLQDVYEIVPVGIEDLARTGRVESESVDCIVGVLCLCGVPEPERNIRELYGYLKPGGRWFVYEHVRCSRSQGLFMRTYQALLNLIWPYFIGGCEMCRDTEKYLREAGPWSEIDLAHPPTEQWYFTLPHIFGSLKK